MSSTAAALHHPGQEKQRFASFETKDRIIPYIKKNNPLMTDDATGPLVVFFFFFTA